MSGSEFEGATYRAIFQWLPLPVILLDDELKVILANHAAAQLLHLRNGATGLPITSILRQKQVGELMRDFGGKQTKTLEISIPRRRWRAPLTVRITMRRLVSRGGTVRSARREFRLLVLEDVTSKVEMEEQLVQAEKVAGMGQLAAGIAHELSNPLSSIASNLLFVRDRVAQDQPTLEAIEATAERLDDMRQLLATLSGFTRPHQPRYEPTDLHDLIRRAVAFVAREAEARGIQLSVAFAPTSLECEVDVRVIKQVLLNLLKNAMEAMPEGGRLEVRTRPAAPEANSAAIVEIADSGIGIAETDLRRVFRPLYSTKPHGTGLGLPFCRQAIEEHGGEIRIASRKGSGTTITFTLPRCQATPNE
jgi:signal transduction histidine kinase